MSGLKILEQRKQIAALQHRGALGAGLVCIVLAVALLQGAWPGAAALVAVIQDRGGGGAVTATWKSGVG